jgi:hypothetical protein
MLTLSPGYHNTTKYLSGGLDDDSLSFGQVAQFAAPTQLDLAGSAQATAGLNLATWSPPDFANFGLVDTHSIKIDVWAYGAVTGNLLETVAVSATSHLDAHGNLVGAISEQITINATITDGFHVVAVKLVDTINLTLSGSGYTGSGTSTSIAAAMTTANGVTQPNGQDVHLGNGAGAITGAHVSVQGAPSWNFAFLSHATENSGHEHLVIDGSETQQISVGRSGFGNTYTAQTTTLHVDASDVGVTGVVTDPAAHHTTSIFA